MIETKILSKPKGNGGGGSSTSSTRYISGTISEAEHAARADKSKKADNATQADYATSAGNAKTADYARKAAEVDGDAEALQNYLRKDHVEDDADGNEHVEEVDNAVLFDRDVGFLKGFTTQDLATFMKAMDVYGKASFYGLANFMKTISTTTIENSGTIKTKNLEVTGSAHFFELIIDKVKSAGGAALFTPADGFDVDMVTVVDGGYRLFWRCRDGNGKQRDNMWKKGDQALCMSFNRASVSASYYVSNKYYWALVTAVSNNTSPYLLNDEYYNYIEISVTDCDGKVNPEVGDSIVMLGYRGSDDKDRQSAIYISAYTSLDSGLIAPLFAQYRGINDFDLGKHRTTYHDARGSKVVGQFELESGESIEDYVDSAVDGATSAFEGQLTATATAMTSQYKELSGKYNDMEGKYNDLPLKNQSDLTEYTSTIEQTARKISLSVSEKAVGRRNLLVGSEFKRFDSGNMLSNSDASACRLRTGDQVDGYNSCRIVSDSTSYNYNGVVFKNIAVNTNTTYALTTWAKRMSESLGAGCVVIVHEKKAFDGTVTNQQSWVLLSDAKDASGNYIDAVDEWKLKTRSFTPQSTTRYINVIFCVRTYGKFAVCKPILEEGDSYNGYSKSSKDYDYIGGNMIDNSRDLTRGGTLVGVAGTVQKTLNDDYAATIVTASGNASVGAFSIKKTLKAGVDYVLSWYIRRTSSDENGQCTVNLGRKILYSELHTGKQAVNSVEGGSSPYSGYQSIYPVPVEWTRMWVHFRLSEDWTDTDNQFYIQLYKGTADSITAQLSRPKLEEGAYPTEWTDNPKTYVEEGSMANKLLATGIDVVNKKVTVTADNFTVRNNSGVETMMVNEDGTLNAALVKAQQLETLGTNGQRIVIENGLLAVIGLAGVANWRFGLDDNNKSVLSYYDDNGNKLYDLGPDGLTKVKITEGTFTSGSYVNATAIGLSVSAYNSLYTTTHTSTSATGKVSVTETRLSNTSDDTILFKNVSSKTLGEQFNKTTLYQYRAPRVNDVIQADSGNNLTTQALAQQADGKYFTSKTICNGSSLQNLASGCFFAASSKIANQSKFIVAGLDQYDSISLSLYAIQSPISITNGAKSLGIVGQIRSREQYTQIGLANNSYVSID